MKIRLMSYNTQHCLNFLTREIDFDLIEKTIRDYKADVVGLQEIRGESAAEDYEAQAKILAERLGFHYYFAEAIRFEGVNPYGNALLSRFPILSAETIPIPDPAEPAYHDYYETRCLLKAELDVAGGLSVLVSHFGLNPDEQENAVETVLAHLKPGCCVLMGDLNMVPDNPLILRLAQNLYDTAELFEKPLFSCPSPAPARKIDYIFTSRDLRVLDADIPQIVTSDHCPHLADVEL